jgi:hypothetical protein
MSETKHTPGPWKCERSGDGKYYLVGDGQSSWGTHVAEVYSDDTDKHEAAANARLIHASPELLAYAVAEQTLRDTTEYSPNAHGELRKALGVPDEFKCIGDYLDALRKAAIAKATLPPGAIGEGEK